MKSTKFAIIVRFIENFVLFLIKQGLNKNKMVKRLK